jgi:hypothetical protein
MMFYADPDQRRAYRWCFRHSSPVWLAEIRDFFHGRRLRRSPRALADFAGTSFSEEAPLAPPAAARTPFHRP